jgi:UDP-N-acetylglucosamine acyltransferase
MIDPSAVVHPDARIGEGVSIGPFSVIAPAVEIGEGTEIGPHVVIKENTRIGAHNRIFQFCSIGEAPQHTGYRGEPTRLEIGDRNVIREYCTLNRGTPDGKGVTRIGNDNFIMAYVHIAHDCVVGDHTVFANCASLAGHVLVEDYAILGGFTTVHQFCRVGAHCITGISTATVKDVPPYVMAAGNMARPHGINVKGLNRRGFSVETIHALKRAYKTVYRSGILLSDALAQLAEQDAEVPEVTHFAEFIRQSRRGVIR